MVEPVGEPVGDPVGEPVWGDDGAPSGDFGGMSDSDGEYQAGEEHSGEGDACKKCREEDNQGEMVICDECTGAYHIYCIDPVLEQVPAEEVGCVRGFS